MRQLGGLYHNHPKVALLMLIPLFSLVGIPPLSGFWPKLSLFTASFTSSNFWLLGAMIFASFITLFLIARMWSEVFWKSGDSIPKRKNFQGYNQMKFNERFALMFAIGLLALVSLYIGFGAEHIQTLASRIANELLTPDAYLDAVLNHVHL